MIPWTLVVAADPVVAAFKVEPPVDDSNCPTTLDPCSSKPRNGDVGVN
jgi:hypothetical protein